MAKRGENIYKRKDGRWEARFKPDGFGGYKYIYARTYKEAKEKLYELKAKARFLPDKKLTVAELCKEWLEYKNQDIKESTYIKYRNIITNYINPYFGSKCIGSLETADMQKFVFQLKNSGLSCKSIRDILSVTSSVIKYASKIGCCTSSLSLGEL